MSQEDRRIRRTRTLLNNALIELIKEKNYDEITVQEITDRADVGHRTFYRHYADKDELLVDVMKDTLSGFKDLFVLPASLFLPLDETDNTPQENGRRLFEYVGKQEELFKVLFQRQPAVYQTIMDFACNKTVDLLQEKMEEGDSPIPFRIMANHLSMSTIELMKLWLEDGKPYPADVMGKYLFQMVLRPIRVLLSENR